MDSPLEKTDVLAAAIRTFNESDFKSMDTIESGGEATTYLAHSASYGQVCAKLFHSREAALQAAGQNNRREINFLLKHAFHPNIIRVLGYFADKSNSQGQIGYVMEFMPGGSLHSVIHSQLKYSQFDAYNWIIQAGRGLLYLHEAGIIHRDVKPKNMLLDKLRETLKLSDFGLAKAVSSDSTHLHGGTIPYMAPELISQGNAFGPASDVYAFGISCWEIFHRKLPYGKEIELALLSKVAKGARPLIRDTLDPLLAGLLKRCWSEDASKRCTIIEMVNFATRKIEGRVSRAQTSSKENTSNNLVSNGTVIEEQPETLKNTQRSKEPEAPITTISQKKSDEPPPLPPHKQVYDTVVDSSTSTIITMTNITLYEDTWAQTHRECKTQFLTNLVFAAAPKRRDLLPGIELFYWNCQKRYETWKQGERKEAKEVIVAHADILGDIDNEHLSDDFQQRYKEKWQKIDFGMYFNYGHFILICYYNSKYFTTQTEQKLNEMKIILDGLSRLFECKVQSVARSLETRQFNCLIVGDGVHPANYYTRTEQFAHIDRAYHQNFHALTIPKEVKIEERVDLIWEKVHSIGPVNSILLLLDDWKEYTNFGATWEKLKPYMAVVLYHTYPRKATDEPTISQQHLKKVFRKYAHNVYFYKDEKVPDGIFISDDDVSFIFYMAYDRSLSGLIDNRPPFIIHSKIDRLQIDTRK